jgi:hypothetical protein
MSELSDLKQDIRDIKENLSQHMARTAASEARLEIMEDFTRSAMDNAQKNFTAMLESNEKNQNAMNRQLKIALGVFAALSTFVGALAAWFAN